MNKSNVIDLDEIEIEHVSVYVHRGSITMDVSGANVDEILDTIGEDTVREYFNIEEEA